MYPDLPVEIGIPNPKQSWPIGDLSQRWLESWAIISYLFILVVVCIKNYITTNNQYTMVKRSNDWLRKTFMCLGIS
jgi:hypothetical protein